MAGYLSSSLSLKNRFHCVDAVENIFAGLQFVLISDARLVWAMI